MEFRGALFSKHQCRGHVEMAFHKTVHETGDAQSSVFQNVCPSPGLAYLFCVVQGLPMGVSFCLT
jgi:hypothetical protein